jgi:hypothetical protein
MKAISVDRNLSKRCRMNTPALAPAPVHDPSWYASHDELVSFASLLVELYALGPDNSAADLLRYFEKPWQWTNEHARWVALGRPGADDVSAEYLITGKNDDDDDIDGEQS